MSSSLLDEIDILVNESPQLIIDICKDAFKANNVIVPVLCIERIKMEERTLTPIDKLKTIATFYETPTIFSLLVFLKTNRKIQIEKIYKWESKSILPHLKDLGISKEDIEHIRLIRNAVSHKYK